MWRVLKSYFFWTYPRGSFHYDVMVTLILAFIFITPRIWNYHDRPVTHAAYPLQVTVQTDGPDGLIFNVPADQLKPLVESTPKWQLHDAIQTIAGPVKMDRYEAVTNSTGDTVAYKVWAHR